MPSMADRLLSCVCALMLCVAAGLGHAEQVKIGVLHTTGSGPAFIAQDKGYFAAEGLQPQLVFFEAAQPIAVATASGDIDLAYTGLTGALYGLASQGVLRIVGGGTHENPGVPYQPVLASNRAYEAGLRSFKDMAGRSVALSVIGSPPHYALALLAQKYGVDLKSLRLLQFGSIANVVSAITGGQADITLMPGNTAVPLLQRGDAKLLGWVGDEVPNQLVSIFVTTKTANERGPMVEHCLAALRKASRWYHEAFFGPDGRRQDGPTAAETIAILAKNAGQSPEEARRSLPYIDAEARLDIRDVLRQIDWYRAQGMVKGPLGGDEMIDRRYVVPLPESAS